MPPDVHSLPPASGQMTTTTPPSAMTQPEHPSQPHSNSSRRSSRSLQHPTQLGTMSLGYGSGGDTNGPGPLRHPRPLTAAELHWQLEKEQEAVVNRLTRELAQLRQQSASVASTTSSTSATGHDSSILDPTDGHLSTSYHSATAPAPPRHRRSSSSVSNRGRLSIGGTPAIPIHATTTRSQASIERARETISRQNSVTSRRSRASSPSQHPESLPQYYQHRPSLSSHHSAHHPSLVPGASTSPTTYTFPPAITTMATSRYEETAMHRAELETAMRENEALKRRIRELESLVRSGGGDQGSGAGTGSRTGGTRDKEVDGKDQHDSKDDGDHNSSSKAEETSSSKGYAETS